MANALNLMNDSPSIPTRPSLLERLKRHDDSESWQRFYDTYWRLIFNFARKQGLAEQDAEEVVQETLIATARQLPGFRYDPSRCAFKSWLLGLTHGKVVDVLRRQYRRQAREAPLEELPPDAGVEGLPAPAELQSLWDEEWRRHLWDKASERVRAKGKVSDAQWQVFDYSDRQGKSAVETAKATGYHVLSVPVIGFRVRRLMKAELKRLENEIV